MFQDEFEKGEFSFIFIKEEPGENTIEDIKNFITNKKAFFFSALEFGKQNNINRLYKEMNMFFEIKDTSKKEVTLEETCDYIVSNARNRMIWIIEGIEEVIDDSDFLEVEKMLKALKSTNNMIIFISHSASFANKFEKSKLTKYLINKELNNIRNFYTLNQEDNMSAEDKFKYYAILGTKKEYRNKVDYSKGLKSNIIDGFLNKNGYFYFEPKKILKKELRETQIYNIILEAVAKGASTLNDISEYVDMPTSICNKYITVMISLGIVEKIKPAFGKDTRKSRYKIVNPVMNFWYYFVPENISDISLNKGDKVFDEKVEKNMNFYLETKFPDLCRDYINKLKKEDKIKIDIKENNIWWNKDETIDIIAGSGLEAIVADCFWNKENVGIEEFYNLEKKAKDVDVIEREYYLFSKSGFTKELLELEKARDDLKLISFSDMVSDSFVKPKKIGFFFSKNK